MRVDYVKLKFPIGFRGQDYVEACSGPPHDIAKRGGLVCVTIELDEATQIFTVRNKLASASFHISNVASWNAAEPALPVTTKKNPTKAR